MNEKSSSPKAAQSLLNDQFPSHVIRLLMQNQSKTLPKLDFACLHCQNQKELTCFCRLMNLVSWTLSQKTAITLCDGIFLTYMTKSERELWQNYFETLAQKKQLEEFLQTLKKPKETQKDTLKAYNDLVAGVNSKIFSLLSAARLMKKSVAEIQNRLESPDCKKNIQLVTHQILQANLYAKNVKARE